jgi:ParB/RepB/Spo0J family partition protein
LARPDFRSQAARRLAAERVEHTPALIDLLRPDEHGTVTEVHHLPIGRISSDPEQPRQRFDEGALQDLAASIREHGILQPILVRPRADGHFQLIAGERRWRAARMAGLTEVPAIVELIDDEAALEIAIIENLQREDISPLEEADLFERMTTRHGYSLRKLAQKLGKDKGYIENRLRLADAPPEVRELVAARSDTLSAAYELMKVSDPRKRRRLAAQVATGELSLVKLRQRIEGRRPTAAPETALGEPPEHGPPEHPLGEPPETSADEDDDALLRVMVAVPVEAAGEPSKEVADVEAQTTAPARSLAPMTQADGAASDIGRATEHLASAVNELADALRWDTSLSVATSADRQQFAKYLTVAKIKLENAIAVVRAGGPRGPAGGAADMGRPAEYDARTPLQRG